MQTVREVKSRQNVGILYEGKKIKYKCRCSHHKGGLEGGRPFRQKDSVRDVGLVHTEKWQRASCIKNSDMDSRYIDKRKKRQSRKSPSSK